MTSSVIPWVYYANLDMTASETAHSDIMPVGARISNRHFILEKTRCHDCSLGPSRTWPPLAPTKDGKVAELAIIQTYTLAIDGLGKVSHIKAMSLYVQGAMEEGGGRDNS